MDYALATDDGAALRWQSSALLALQEAAEASVNDSASIFST
jgi:hypothetical protein